MVNIPTETKEKPVSFGDTPIIETPEPSGFVNSKPRKTATLGEIPKESDPNNEIPKESNFNNETPKESEEKEEKPSGMIDENCVVVNGKIYEIKPTKFKYFRNKAAAGYNAIKKIPIQEFLTYPKGVFDDTRDADHILFDFLVATFDDVSLVRDNYNNFDTEILDRIIKIFGRINHIDEKEEATRKNMEAQTKH